jgi:hypothetical protein
VVEIIDTQVQMDAVHWNELEVMALAGIVAVIADSAPRTSPKPTAQWTLDYFDRTLNYDSVRAAEFFIDTYVLVGINMHFVPPDYEKIIDALPRYLSQPKVVGVGESGLDPKSLSKTGMATQEEIVRSELKLTKEHGKAALLHLPWFPAERAPLVERYFELIDEVKIDPGKVVITHADSSLIKMIVDFGCIAGIAVQPWRKLTPDDAARMLQSIPLDRVVLNCDVGPKLASDVLGVPKTALEMRKLGFKEGEIRKVVYDNPKRVFNLP